MTKHILAVIVLLAMTWPAWGQNNVALPPAEFDHPHKGWLTIERISSQTELRGKCPYSPFPYLLGCARHAMDVCYIFMADDEFLKKLKWPYEIVLRHETGHCNGWPSHHPGGRSVTEASAPKSPAPSPESLLPGLASAPWRVRP
jgi:hypothetical protein